MVAEANAARHLFAHHPLCEPIKRNLLPFGRAPAFGRRQEGDHREARPFVFDLIEIEIVEHLLDHGPIRGLALGSDNRKVERRADFRESGGRVIEVARRHGSFLHADANAERRVDQQRLGLLAEESAKAAKDEAKVAKKKRSSSCSSRA